MLNEIEGARERADELVRHVVRAATRDSKAMLVAQALDAQANAQQLANAMGVKRQWVHQLAARGRALLAQGRKP